MVSFRRPIKTIVGTNPTTTSPNTKPRARRRAAAARRDAGAAADPAARSRGDPSLPAPTCRPVQGRLFAGIVLQLIDLLSTVVTIALFAYIVDNVLVAATGPPVRSHARVDRRHHPQLHYGLPGGVTTRGCRRANEVTTCATTCTNGLSSWRHVRRWYPSGDLIARLQPVTSRATSTSSPRQSSPQVSPLFR